jgi:uncharacterized protein (TIGR03437 family)
MRQILRISTLLAILLLSIHTTESFVRSRLNASTALAWNLANPRTPIVSNGRVTYSIDSAGSDDVPFSEVEQAIDRSFQAWENVPTSVISFQRGPNITSDKSNLPGVFDLFWVEDSTIIPVGDDEIDISGALAVTFISFSTAPANAGEIIDLFIVFNGNQATWATDGNPGAFDIQQVATHEVGHAIGISHSPHAASTMFPRTGPGSTLARSLSTDDQIAASVIYPSPIFASTTGNITGRVRDNNGAPIFGAHVVAVDANGIVITGVLSQPDGTYSIQGLSPGNYTIYAEPLDADDNPFFSRDNLGGFYQNSNIDFQTSRDFQVGVSAGATTPFDFSVTRGNPAFDVYAVLDSSGEVFRTVGTTVLPGSIGVLGVIGPGLPQSGFSFSVTGPGITIEATQVGTIDGLPFIIGFYRTDLSITPGTRNIIIDNGAQRAIVTGAVEVIISTFPINPTVTSIVSQTHLAPLVAVESLATVFGTNLSGAAGITPPNLPTSFAGTTILIRDSAGNERLAPLLYVASTQINFQIPSGIQAGPATFVFTNSTEGTVTTTVDIQPVAPGLFTFSGAGSGPPNGFAIRFRADGTSSQEPIARFDQAQGIWVPVPIDLGPASDRVLLVLFGTGFRFPSQLPSVNIGGVACQVVYAGPEGNSPQLRDQVNVFLNRSLGGTGVVNVEMTVDGRQANTVVVSIGGAVPVPPTVTGIVKQTDFSPFVAAESLATALGSNLATATASANTNPLPITLAGSTITLTDSLGNVRQAPLMYASPGQINFRIPPGIQPGNATITFSNSTGGTFTGTIGIFPAAPGLFTFNGAGSGPPNGFVLRFRSDGTSSQEPIASFDQAQGIWVPVPIDLGPPSDRVLLVLFGTGFRFGATPALVTIGGVDYPAVYAGPEGNSPQLRDQVNVFLDRSLSGAGLVNALMKVDGSHSNLVEIFIQ